MERAAISRPETLRSNVGSAGALLLDAAALPGFDARAGQLVQPSTITGAVIVAFVGFATDSLKPV
jgi:hypothetical protein